MHKKAILIVGNGQSAALLTDHPMTGAIEVIALNRLLHNHRTDLVSVVRPDYREELARQWPEWPRDRCIQGHAESSIELAFRYAAQQGWQQVFMLGMDGTTMAMTERHQPHEAGTKLTNARIGNQQRWQQQMKSARRRTGVMPLILQDRSSVVKLSKIS